VRLEGKAHVSGKLREVWLRTAHSSQLLPVVPKYSELRFSGTEGTTVTDHRVPVVAFTPKSLNETDEARSRDCGAALRVITCLGSSKPLFRTQCCPCFSLLLLLAKMREVPGFPKLVRLFDHPFRVFLENYPVFGQITGRRVRI
jgi:hypothetical protein